MGLVYSPAFICDNKNKKSTKCMCMYHRWILLVTQSFLHWLGVAVFCFVCVMFVSTLTWKVVIAAASMESF